MAGQSIRRTLWLARMVAFPVLAGLLIFWRYGAPAHYAWVNSGAFLLGLVAIHFGRLPQAGQIRHILAFALLALFTLPLVTGPETGDIARWIGLGPVRLNTGLLVLPLLAVIAVRDNQWGWVYLTAALAIAALQPDAAAALAITFALAAIAVFQRRLTLLVLVVAGLVATGVAFYRGALPPVPFAEGLVPMLWDDIGAPIHAAAIALAPIVTLLYFLLERTLSRHDGLMLAAVLSGFLIAAFAGPYPYPLAGYGAAAILGFMFAIAATPRNPEVKTADAIERLFSHQRD